MSEDGRGGMTDDAPQPPMTGAVLNERYELRREIGRGGMGIVYEALDRQQDRSVAVKMLRPEISRTVAEERFLREIAIASHLQHPLIVPLFDSGRSQGVLYYVMPLLEGESLRDRINRESQLGVDESLAIVGEIGDALNYAHEQGVVHRDVKPENVMLCEGHAMLMDFGIAHAIAEIGGEALTSTGIAIGTPSYMSPEQVSGSGGIDGRSDQYSLGCVLFEMLVGQPPFTGATAQSIIARHLGEPPPSVAVVRPSVSRAVEAVLKRSLEKVPADRFPTAKVFTGALDTARSSGDRRVTLRGTLMAAAAVIVPVLGVLAGRQVLIGMPEAPLDRRRVVVFPLAEHGELTEGAGYEAAIMISSLFEHAQPLRWFDGRAWMSDEERIDPSRMTAEKLEQIARDRGARYYVEGFARQGDSTRIVLRLHDVEADSQVTQVAADGPAQAGSVVRLGQGAAIRLLPALLDPERSPPDLTPITDRRPEAIAAWIVGERAYRRCRFLEALAAYQEAIAIDSAMALAAVKGAQAATWSKEHEELVGPLLDLALSNAQMLPERYALFAQGLDAYVNGLADSAVARFRRLLRLDPEWAEAHMALGETFYHLLPAVSGPIDSLAHSAFSAAERYDSSFSPPLLHLSEIAFRQGEAAERDRVWNRFRSFEPDSLHLAHALLMQRCVVEGLTQEAWNEHAVTQPMAVFNAGYALMPGARQLDCAEGAFKALLTEAQDPGLQWAGFFGLQGLLAVDNRIDELQQLVDSTTAAGQLAAWLAYTIDGLAGADVIGHGMRAERFLRDLRGSEYEGIEDPTTLWLLGFWHAEVGDTDLAARLHRRLVEVSNEYPAAAGLAQGLSGRLALVRGDTAAAMAALEQEGSVAGIIDLVWDYGASRPLERLWLARLHLARAEYRDAIAVASTFDHQGAAVFFPFVAESLRIRHEAARALGDRRLTEELAARLTAIGRADLL